MNEGILAAEHRGYFSNGGWAARCLRQHLNNLRLGLARPGPTRHQQPEAFTLQEVCHCVEAWLDFGDRTYVATRAIDSIHELEQAARRIVALCDTAKDKE